MKSTHDVTVPVFKLSQTDKEWDFTNKLKIIGGKIEIAPEAFLTKQFSEKEALVSNTSFNIEHSLDAMGDKDVIFITFRQKIEGDFLYGICACPFNNYNTEVLNIKVPEMTIKPQIIISGK